MVSEFACIFAVWFFLHHTHALQTSCKKMQSKYRDEWYILINSYYCPAGLQHSTASQPHARVHLNFYSKYNELFYILICIHRSLVEERLLELGVVLSRQVITYWFPLSRQMCLWVGVQWSVLDLLAAKYWIRLGFSFRGSVSGILDHA